MGKILICDAGAVSDPGAAFTPVLPGAGSTFTVRATGSPSKQYLVGLARGGATKGEIQVKSPYLSDNVEGIRYAVAAGVQDDLLSAVGTQSLRPQDTLSVAVTGGAAEYDGALLSSYFEDLSGASPKLKMPGDVSGLFDYVTTWQVNAAASVTPGDWNPTAINALYDVSKANRWYAVLGYVVDTPVLGVALNGADTSNFNIGGPGVTDPYKTKAYFADLSLELGQPCVPCFDTANKGNTTIQVVDVVASTAVNVTLIVGILPETWNP